jgi:hypothetical protein
MSSARLYGYARSTWCLTLDDYFLTRSGVNRHWHTPRSHDREARDGCLTGNKEGQTMPRGDKSSYTDSRRR